MGFFRKTDAARWVDSDTLRWTPDRPFGFEPRAGNDGLRWTDDGDGTPRAAEPEFSAPPESDYVREARPEILPEPDPVPEPLPANSNRSAGFATARLAIGLAQGLGLYA